MDADRARQIIAINQRVAAGHWTTYADIGELVYGHRRAAQTVHHVLETEGDARTAHRTLRTGGEGPEASADRLREEGAWDDALGRARTDRYLDAAALRQLARRRLA